MNVTESFFALLATEKDRAVQDPTEISLECLDPGDSIIEVQYSSLNYKDALGLLAKSPIYRKFPIVGGIDLSGRIVSSESSHLKSGESVLITGCGLGENHTGGYSQFARVPSDWIIPIPKGLSPRQVMQLGTAGFTAALAIHRLEENHQTPEKGPILITGASGGVGQFSVSLLKKLGFEVVAVSGKPQSSEKLLRLGATEVLQPGDIKTPRGPLSSVKWAGCIDCVGGELLEKVLPQIDLWGNVCSIGVAAGARFQSTVMPHILRGVSILGISSTNCPMELRTKLWQRLDGDLKMEDLDAICSKEISLQEVPATAKKLLNREVIGRYLVKL